MTPEREQPEQREQEETRRLSIRVECCGGYQGVQEPVAFWLGNRRLKVQALVDRWFAPGQYWFKVDADDGNIYVLKYDENVGNWEIAAYRSGALR